MEHLKFKLPFLISIPHGGDQVPCELRRVNCLSKADMLKDGDAFTVPIYDLSSIVKNIVKTNIARAFIDLNRTENQLPPEYPDGIFKLKTCCQKQIYKTGRLPERALRNKLLQKYARPYHAKIHLVLKDPSIQFAFDCHSMAETAPPVAPNPGEERPLICLSNRNGQTCSETNLILLKTCFIEIFQCDAEDVHLNHPFQGGSIIQTYGRQPVPWIQIEISRKLYLSEPWFDKTCWKMDERRLQTLNGMMQNVLLLFHQKRQQKHYARYLD